MVPRRDVNGLFDNISATVQPRGIIDSGRDGDRDGDREWKNVAHMAVASGHA